MLSAGSYPGHGLMYSACAMLPSDTPQKASISRTAVSWLLSSAAAAAAAASARSREGQQRSGLADSRSHHEPSVPSSVRADSRLVAGARTAGPLSSGQSSGQGGGDGGRSAASSTDGRRLGVGAEAAGSPPVGEAAREPAPLGPESAGDR